MSLGALPSVYDLSTPESNLSGPVSDYVAWDGSPLSGLESPSMFDGAPSMFDGVMPDFIEQNRVTWGEDLIGPVLGALHGYRRSGGSIIQAALWAVLGYVAPLPAVGASLYESSTGKRLF